MNDPMNVTDLFFVVLGLAGCLGIGAGLAYTYLLHLERKQARR